MSPVTLLRAADRAAQPWKNGGGVTREIAAFPPGAGMADFEWRISQADVAEAGPFSRFEGVDRVLTVLAGELALTFDEGRDPVRLTSHSAPFAFAGDIPVWGAPAGGPVRDLNVMVRRGKATAKVTTIALEANHCQRLDLPARCILVARDALTIGVEGETHALADLDAIMVEGPSSALVTACENGDALIVIAIDPPA